MKFHHLQNLIEVQSEKLRWWKTALAETALVETALVETSLVDNGQIHLHNIGRYLPDTVISVN